MANVKSLRKRLLPFALVFAMVAGMFSGLPILGTQARAADEVELGRWSFVQGGTSTTATLPQYATGVFADSKFEHYANTGVSYTASNASVYTNGWDNADATDKYWLITTESTGYEALNVSFNAWGSNTGPKNFVLEISTDSGDSWIGVESYELTATANTNYSIDLPTESDGLAELLIRFRVVGTGSINDGTVAGTGTSRMANIVISGTPTGEDPVDPTDPPGPEVISISEANAAAAGKTVTVEGEVTYLYSGSNYKSLMIQDGTGPSDGICVYIAATDLSEYMGKAIRVTGNRLNYSGLKEIVPAGKDDIEVISDSVTAVPTEVSVADLAAGKYACMLVSLKDVQLTARNAATTTQNHTVSRDGASVTLRTALSTEYLEGDWISVSGGCVYVYSSAPQLLCDASAVSPGTEPIPPDLGWTLEGESATVVGLAFSGTTSQLSTDKTGDYAGDSTFSFIKDGAVITPNYSSGGANVSGLNGMADKAYWLLETSSAQFDNLVISGTLRSSGTGPRDFQAQYSTDGQTWIDVPNGAITSGNTVHKEFSVELPVEASNQSKLYVRLILTSNIAMRAGTTSGSTTYPADDPIQSGGTHQIQNVLLKGEYILLDGQVSPVTADPAPPAAPAGANISLSSATDGAAIMVSFDGVTFSEAESVTLDTLPAAFYAKAAKDGMIDSRVKAFSYTQAQADIVRPDISDRVVTPGTEIYLLCDTPDASIYYAFVSKSDDTPDEWVLYDGNAIVLDTFPAILKAYAAAPNYIDGVAVAYTFEEQMPIGDYNIYFGQLHSHTALSDGDGTPEEAFEYARDVAADIDFLAITDHSNMFDNASASNYDINGQKTGGSASTEWERLHQAATDSTTEDFLALVGYEMTWSGSTGGFGHINTFNTSGFESRNDSYFTSNTSDQTTNGLYRYYERLLEANGSISQFNHPGTTFGDFLDFKFYDPEYDAVMQLIEVGNGEGEIGSGDYYRSYEAYDRALSRGWHLAPTNNQDNHEKKWGDANTGRTVVLASGLTADEIYSALRERRVYATEDSNLQIRYSVNGYPLGYIYPDGKAPDELDFYVQLTDPDNVIEGSVISIIADGGQVVKTITVSGDNSVMDETGTIFTWEFTLPTQYSYYYVKVVEPSGLMAVTAPVWTGSVEKTGISRTSTTTVMPVKGEALPVKTTFFNDESGTLNITHIEYSIEGRVICSEDVDINVTTGTNPYYEFEYTPDFLGDKTIDVTATGTYDGEPRAYRDTLKITVADPDNLVTLAMDASHYNSYVAGSYAGSYTAFLNVCKANNVRVKLIDAITEENLSDCAAIAITPPATRSGTYTPRDGSPAINYSPQEFTEEELAVLAAFAASGGTFILCGVADYNDNSSASSQYHASKQMNAVLEAIGADTRLNDDEVVDCVNKVNESYRLAFGYGQTNPDSPYTAGVKSNQTYSFYSGCSVALGEGAEWIVKGYDTTFSIDADGDSGTRISAPTEQPSDEVINNSDSYPVKLGEVVALASERLPGGGTAFIGGTVYFSDFEIPDFDATNSLTNSNMMIVWNMLKDLAEPLPVTEIATARSYEEGKQVCIEGIATTYSPAENTSHAFFDCLYVQDETGGINVFGMTNDENGVKVIEGQKVRVTGRIGYYNGDLELKIDNVTDVVVIDESINPVQPKDMTAAEIMNSENNGWLAKIEGVVTEVNNPSGIQTIMVQDEYGDVARVYIDGYIGYSDPDSPKLEDIITVGARISAVGLLSTDGSGQRMRVRDRSEIVLLEEPVIVDKTALKDAIAKAEGVDRSKYTSATLKALQAAVDAGKAVMNDPNATQADVDAAAKAINEAMGALITLIAAAVTSNGNGQADIGFNIRSANGKGYAVYISLSADGQYKLADANFNSKGAHVKGLTNGTTYYAYVEYSANGILERSDIVILKPSK